MDPRVGVIKAVLSLYEREVGPMPVKASYTEQILQMEKDNHAHCVSRCMSPLVLSKKSSSKGSLCLYHPSKK